MKTSIVKTPVKTDFEPFTVQITFESHEEVKSMLARLYYSSDRINSLKGESEHPPLATHFTTNKLYHTIFNEYNT